MKNKFLLTKLVLGLTGLVATAGVTQLELNKTYAVEKNKVEFSMNRNYDKSVLNGLNIIVDKLDGFYEYLKGEWTEFIHDYDNNSAFKVSENALVIFEEKVNQFIENYTKLNISYRNSTEIKECLNRFVCIFDKISDYFKQKEKEICHHSQLNLKDRIAKLKNSVHILDLNCLNVIITNLNNFYEYLQSDWAEFIHDHDDKYAFEVSENTLMNFEKKVNKFIENYKKLNILYRNPKEIEEYLDRFICIFCKISNYFEQKEKEICHHSQLNLKDRIAKLENIVYDLK